MVRIFRADFSSKSLSSILGRVYDIFLLGNIAMEESLFFIQCIRKYTPISIIEATPMKRKSHTPIEYMETIGSTQNKRSAGIIKLTNSKSD